MKHAVTWFEIMGTDMNALKSFYSKLFNWEFEGIEGVDNYTMVKSDGKSACGEQTAIPGGIGQLPAEVPRGYTTVYVEVEDLATQVAKARDLGAEIIIEDMPIPTGKIAMFMDPQQNPIGLVQMVKS